MMKASITTQLALEAAREEVAGWLTGVGRTYTYQRASEYQFAQNNASALVHRFLAHAERAGFSLSHLATGSLSNPRFQGVWHHDGQPVQLQRYSDAAERDDASLLACAALLKNDLLRHQIAEARSADAA